MRWAEADDDTFLPPPEVIGPDKNGIKTKISYRMEDGKRVKVTQKYQIIRTKKKISKKVQERKELARFGQVKEGEDGFTTLSREEIKIEDLTENYFLRFTKPK